MTPYINWQKQEAKRRDRYMMILIYFVIVFWLIAIFARIYLNNSNGVACDNYIHARILVTETDGDQYKATVRGYCCIDGATLRFMDEEGRKRIGEDVACFEIIKNP